MSATSTVEAGPDILAPFNLDDVAEPSGPPIVIKRATYYFASDDDLSIDDRENLRLFSLRLREMEAWEVDPETGLMTADNKKLMRASQVAMAKIAVPNCPIDVLSKLEDIQLTKLLDLFFGQAKDLRWIDKTVFRWLVNRSMPEASRNGTSGESTRTPIDNGSSTSDDDTFVSLPI